MNHLAKRVFAMDDKIKNIETSNADQQVALDELRNELGSISGEMELLKRQLEQQSEETKKIIQDMDVRLAELEKKTSSSPSSKVDKKKILRPESPLEHYDEALLLMNQKKKYVEAIESFRDFLKVHGKHELAGNAQYWIGEGYYAQGKFIRSIKEFDRVVKKYPKSKKVCDALLKQGLGFQSLKKKTQAKLFFEEVKIRCPKTTASKTAVSKLKTLK